MTRSSVSAFSSRRRHPLAAVLVLLLALTALGGLYAALAPVSRADTAPNAESDAVAGATSTQVEEGRKLFAIGCASCHGLGGEGAVNVDGTPLGPSLVGAGAAAVDFQVGTGRMPMAAPGAQAPRKKIAYTEEQIDILAAYVASLGPGPEIPSEEQYNPEEGEVARGGVLYRSNCASCHNTSGQGGALTYGKYAPKLTGVEPKHVYEAMLTGPQSMPVFSDKVLTPEDKRDIVAYLSDIEQQPDPGGLGVGRIGPVSEGLWAWVVGLGAMIGAAVWIGAKSS